MQLKIDEFLKDIVGFASNFITILYAGKTYTPPKYESTIANEEQEDADKSSKKKKKQSSFPRFRQLLGNGKIFLPLVFFIALCSILAINLLGDITIPLGPKTSLPSISPNGSYIMPIEPTGSDAWLDELDPIIPKRKAFFLYNWSSFDPVQVEDVTYPHCIGICIPSEKVHNYIVNTTGVEQTHSEYIEYRLSYQYESLQFKYGIDDISFVNDVETASKCLYKIKVQSCNSKEFLRTDDNILFDSDWNNYRSILFQSPQIDVSGCESIRITAIWKFNVLQDGPIAFNIAIIDPILRAAKADAIIEQQPVHTTKPDSIR